MSRDPDRKTRRIEEITPLRSTGSYPLWRKTADELAHDLERVASTKLGAAKDALKLREKALEYLDTFERWGPSNKPSDEVRTKTIADFLAFHGEVKAFLAAKGGWS